MNDTSSAVPVCVFKGEFPPSVQTIAISPMLIMKYVHTSCNIYVYRWIYIYLQKTLTHFETEQS